MKEDGLLYKTLYVIFWTIAYVVIWTPIILWMIYIILTLK